MTDGSAAAAEMAARLAELTEAGCWEWQILVFADERLQLIGGGDMDYSHDTEAAFHGVTFISCPTRMKHPRFRLATEHETLVSGAYAALEPGAVVVAIEGDAINDFDRTWFITARSVEVKRGLFRHAPTGGTSA
ncbi:MAG TPA: hypothetical protein VEX86_11560 [Longimicrobium sp.]|nr:hypothetical protein [Longimicrobium sp.]